MTDKAAVRSLARQRRRALSTEDRRRRSAAAAAQLLGMREVRAARSIGLYVALADEVDPAPAAAALLAEGARLLLPRVDAARSVIEFVEVDDLGSLRPGFRGVLEPVGVARHPPELDLLVVPGVAFDARGGRLGQGGGHYDRLLASLDQGTLLIGLAFACQVVEEVPREPHDRSVHAVVTEDGVRWAVPTPSSHRGTDR
jgi:5-formyltetrahydrofolate cyclo-ligase